MKRCYTNTKHGFTMEIFSRESQYGMRYTAKLTNNATGATKESAGWRSREVAMEELRDMLETAVREQQAAAK